MKHRDGRMFQPTLPALLRDTGDGRELCAPAPGLWRGGPRPKSLVIPGDSLGELEILGVLHTLVAPAGTHGVVSAGPASGLARRPVAYGQRLVLLQDAGPRAVPDRDREHTAAAAPQGLVFCSPMSGRYYSRPGPDKPPFVQVGDEISAGTTVCLLEVMKTFNRVTYGGDGLPERARIKAIVPADEQDLEAGDIILHLE